MAMAFLGVPLALFAVLAVLPGRWALAGFGGALLLLGAAWWEMGRDGIGGDGAGFGPALVMVWGLGVVAAALAQGIRAMLPAGRPGWVYPLVVVAVLVAAGVPALTVLGM